MLYIPREICESWPSKALPKQGKQDTFIMVIKLQKHFWTFMNLMLPISVPSNYLSLKHHSSTIEMNVFPWQTEQTGDFALLWA